MKLGGVLLYLLGTHLYICAKNDSIFSWEVEQSPDEKAVTSTPLFLHPLLCNGSEIEQIIICDGVVNPLHTEGGGFAAIPRRYWEASVARVQEV